MQSKAIQSELLQVRNKNARSVFYSGAQKGTALLVSAGLLFSLSACSGKRIISEHEELRPLALFVVTPRKQPLSLQKGFAPERPFHLGVRLSESFLNRAMGELLKAEIVPSTFDAPVQVTVPPFDSKLTLRPSVQALNPSLQLNSACAECVTLSAEFVGKFAVQLAADASSSARSFEGTALKGGLTLQGRLLATQTGGIPSIAVQLDPIADKDLRIEVQAPIPGIDTLVTAAVRSQLKETLKRPGYNTFALLSMKELVIPDSKLGVNEVVFRTVTAPERELQLGLNLNLNTPPEVRFDVFSRSLRKNDMAFSVGENTLTDMMKVWLAEDWLPSRFNTSGDPDPKGDITVDLRAFRLQETGYEAVTRFWYVGTPPFWREYTLNGTIGVRSEAIQISNQKAALTGGEGPNRLIDLALLSQGVSLTKTLGAVGKKMPRQYGFPFGNPTKLEAQLSLEELQTEQHRMTSYHSVSWVPGTGSVSPAR